MSNLTKKEFAKKIFSTLSLEELQNINPVIYHNPDHIDYYIKFHEENYNWCWDYLMKNRTLLK
jgi:aminopeptidase-like protein